LHLSPPFLAVSYTWSQPYRHLDAHEEIDEPVRLHYEITIDGAPFEITADMRDAFMATLSHAVARHTWLDGYCINQSDFAELAAQDLLIGSILAEASEVPSVLGTLHPDLDSFHWLLTDFISKLASWW